MNVQKAKKAVDKPTAFRKWCGKENENVRFAAYLLGLMILSACFMFGDYLFGDQLMIFQDIGSDTWQQYIMNYSAIVNDIRMEASVCGIFPTDLGLICLILICLIPF